MTSGPESVSWAVMAATDTVMTMAIARPDNFVIPVGVMICSSPESSSVLCEYDGVTGPREREVMIADTRQV